VDGARKPSFAESMEMGGNVFPGFRQKAMSHADIIICCAFTEIWARRPERHFDITESQHALGLHGQEVVNLP
jgi:hypothetical protein